MDRGDGSTNEAHVAEHRSVRANRICASCRVWKQRCMPSSNDAQSACQRCARHAMPCSFETQPLDPELPGPSKLAQMVVELQQRVNYHEARIAELERSEGHPRKNLRQLQESNAGRGVPTPLETLRRLLWTRNTCTADAKGMTCQLHLKLSITR
ncbi:hypothetical protein BU23DRAFT_270431 [Bimuria novae-zelandiae CBS 107.79]|uniref:Zn(2)-C6 fungal-type domain-containing protein n=1 Tax=Bimuria novae-zelandiae CBS 107.79 TaxID=1447943 RepID=A0A6A5V481_9PLEO|nr:hypothetical protein BU23DRAFT_270431 [Bimuria novae-zelandiae CBS 107.79]